MYVGTVTEVKWERVFITIIGTLSHIKTNDEREQCFRIRYPKFFPDIITKNDDPEDIDYDEVRDKVEETRERYNEHMRMLTEVIEEETNSQYDTDGIYFFLRTTGYRQTYLLKGDVNKERTRFSIKINVTEFHDRMQIPDGSFRISVFHGGIDYAMLADAVIARDSMDLTRAFIFDKNSKCYVVNVMTGSNEMDPTFILKSFLFSRKRHRRFNMRRICRETRDHIIKFCIMMYYTVIYHLVPHNGKRILFSTESRGTLQGNLKAIYDRIYERGLDKQFKIYTSFRMVAGAHGSAWSWIKLITYVAICDTVLIDDYAPFLNWFHVKKKTRLVQVWHAGVGFKSVGFCRFGRNGTPVIDCGHRQYDYAITGSQHLKKTYSEVFGIEEDAIIATGLPRIDELLDKKKQKSFRENFYIKYPEMSEKKIILFAPTFRGMGAKTAHYPYEKLDFQRIYQLCGEKYIFMMKMHPFIDEAPPIPEEYKKRIVDFSDFPNVNELLWITDILITDYSSVIYEYSLFQKPILFFAYDKDEYSAIRGFQSDYDDFAPGKICTDFDELMNAIENEDFEIEKTRNFVQENYDYLDERSTDRFIDWMLLSDRYK